jgi:hypothetical protein
MNDGFLLADCVFEFLFDSSFIHHSEWKHDTRELYYTATFFVLGTRASTVSFEVTVSDGRHKVTKSIIRLLEKRYSKDFSTVFANCVI